MAYARFAIRLAFCTALRHGPGMAIGNYRRVFRNTAFSVCLCCCLLIQVLIGGFSAGANAAPADDPVSLLAAAICLSQPGGVAPPDLPGRLVDRHASCLAHCLGALASGRVADFAQFEAPADVALADVVAPPDPAVTPLALIEGRGARAPPSEDGWRARAMRAIAAVGPLRSTVD